MSNTELIEKVGLAEAFEIIARHDMAKRQSKLDNDFHNAKALKVSTESKDWNNLYTIGGFVL
jgi:hypothetical protein